MRLPYTNRGVRWSDLAQLQKGLRLLDEAMVAVLADDLSPWSETLTGVQTDAKHVVAHLAERRAAMEVAN